MLEHDATPTRAGKNTEPLLSQKTADALGGDDDLGEEDVPTVVLYVIAGLLFLSFAAYLIVGGGHSHFH